MTSLFPAKKQIEYPVFGRFNHLYGDALIKICSLLEKFTIEIYTVEEYKALSIDVSQILDIDKQTFANFIQKYGETAGTTQAAIIFNADLIRQMNFSEREQYASITHEIGHFLYFFLDDKSNYSGGQGEEIYCDMIASRIGLSKDLLSAIKKLESSGAYPDSLSRFGMRKIMLKQ
jgi:hypothetical protein